MCYECQSAHFLIARTGIDKIIYIELVMYAISLVFILSISKDLDHNFEKVAEQEENVVTILLL